MASKVESSWKRGTIVKTETEDKVALDRRILTREYRLVWHKEKCIGCGICADICPKEAILYFPAEFKAGRRISDRPRINFEPKKCVMCGGCVISCPMDHALVMTVDGRKFNPVVRAKVFTVLTKKTGLSQEAK